jgi:two-component system chemotaxis sensor kinase CheA
VDNLTQQEFLNDLKELTERLIALTTDLGQPPTSEPAQLEKLARTFRCLHSIKGVASSAGFGGIAQLAHQTETLLESVRAGRTQRAIEFTNTLEEVANAISECLETISAGGPEPANEDLLGRLHQLNAHTVKQAGESSPMDLPPEVADLLNEREKQLVIAALGAPGKVFLIDVYFDLAVFDAEFQKLRQTLTELGEVICTLPVATGPTSERIGFRLFLRSESPASEVQAYLLVPCPQAIVKDFPNLLPVDPEIAAQYRQAFDVGDSTALPASRFIRVELAELDRLRAVAHELFAEIVKALELVSNNLSGDARSELKNLDAQVNETLSALEGKILDLRNISADRVIQRSVLAGRVAARTTGKLIEFSTDGGGLRIDKEICDAIAIPLLHLVRNAVDHGIEAPEERSKTGKNSSGVVRVEARAGADHTSFIVADDGRGIDPQVISATAARQGLIEAGVQLSMDESLRMIFRPRFSTAATVSSVSGRGVGLDVVEHSVAQVGGSVSVRSQPGLGSEFELRLPIKQNG